MSYKIISLNYTLLTNYYLTQAELITLELLKNNFGHKLDTISKNNLNIYVSELRNIGTYIIPERYQNIKESFPLSRLKHIFINPENTGVFLLTELLELIDNPTIYDLYFPNNEERRNWIIMSFRKHPDFLHLIQNTKLDVNRFIGIIVPMLGYLKGHLVKPQYQENIKRTYQYLQPIMKSLSSNPNLNTKIALSLEIEAALIKLFEEWI